jgi:hypothetical protein
MSKCNTYNFNINRGETTSFTVRYLSKDGEIIPLTGYNARMQFRTDPDIDTVSLALNSGVYTANRSTIHLTPESGSMLLYISAADTDTLQNEVYFYDLELYTNADPFEKGDSEYVIRLFEGIATTKFNITR